MTPYTVNTYMVPFSHKSILSSKNIKSVRFPPKVGKNVCFPHKCGLAPCSSRKTDDFLRKMFFCCKNVKKNTGIFFTHFDKQPKKRCLQKCVKKNPGIFLHIPVFRPKTRMCKKIPVFFLHILANSPKMTICQNV